MAKIKTKPETFFGTIVSAGSMSHTKHLQIQGDSSGIKHLALNDFYQGVPDIADRLIETCQGYYKKVIDFDYTSFTYGCKLSPTEYLEGIKEMIFENRYDVIPQECTHIHAILDDLLELIDSTLYKLILLK